MRRDVLSGKGVMTRARRKREHPRRPARRAPETSGPSGVTGRVDAVPRLEWADPLTDEERRILEAGWSFVE